MANFLYGSICLTDAIASGQAKKVVCKDGQTRVYLNVSVIERKSPKEFNGKTYTHFISCAPKQEERKEGVQYIIGDLQTNNPQPSMPTAEEIAQSPVATPNDLPF